MSVQLRELKTTRKETISHSIRLDCVAKDASEEEISSVIEAKHGGRVIWWQKHVVDSVRIIRNVNTGESIGIAYVKLKNANDMETVLKRMHVLRRHELGLNTLLAIS